MDKLREWNWASYVLDSACDQRLSWDKNKKKVFAGPALFLTCLYVDRIQVFGSPSRREFPIISNWTTSTLLKRQKKELVNSYFGGGRLRTPIKLLDEYQIQHETDGRNLADEQPKKSSTDGYGQHINLGLRIMQEAVAIAVENASRIENFKKIVSTATTLDLNDQTFKDNVITACKMLRIEININELSKAQDETNIGVDKNQDQQLDSNDMSIKDTGMPASDINELSKAQDETNIGVDKNQDQPLDSNDMSLKDTGMPASDMLGVEMNINPVEKSQDPANIFLYDDPIFESELVDLVDKASAESDSSKTKHFECAFDIPTFDLHFTPLDPTKEHDNTYQQKESLEVAGIERNDGYQTMTGNNVKDVHANNVDVSKIKEKPLRDKDTSSADLGLNKDSDMQKAVEVKNNKGNEPLTYISAYGVRIRGKPAASIGSPLGDVGKGKEASSGKNVGVPKDDQTARGTDAVVLQKKTSSGGDRLPLIPVNSNIMTGTARNTITSKRTMLAKGAKFRSPFCQREISTTKNLTKCEKELGIYAMYKDTRDWKEVLFGFKDTEVNRFNMLSMRTGSPIANDIVNAWAIILNDRENFRSDLSPLRFFARTNLYVDCIEANGISYDNQRSTFFILMTMEIQEYHQNKINLIDMYFFPVYRKGLYYAVCVDLRKGRVFVLDSALDITANEENDIYEEVCNTFKKLLSDLLKYNNEEQKAKIVMNSKMHVVKMKWADPHNTIDAGLYLMSHLEMFMGDASASWKCQFLSTPQRQLRIMRVRYGAAMINWDGNKVKGNIVVQASRVYQDLSKKPEFDADNLLLN